MGEGDRGGEGLPARPLPLFSLARGSRIFMEHLACSGREVALKIAQVAPLYESVPPQLYGGTERVVSYLTEELVRQGHGVTLFASGDSVTSARLISSAPRALRLDPSVKDPLPPLVMMLERVRQRAHEFDVLHFHVE